MTLTELVKKWILNVYIGEEPSVTPVNEAKVLLAGYRKTRHSHQPCLLSSGVDNRCNLCKSTDNFLSKNI